MKRKEIAVMFVLDVIADDYENLEMIDMEVSELGRRCGMNLGHVEIRSALLHLIEAGLAKAYRLSPVRPPEELVGPPSLNEIDGVYFFRTEEGREAQLLDFEGWPFDEQGLLRKDWIPPES